MKKSPQGFALIETLLLLIVVSVLSAVGWYALHTKHQTDQILSQADKISQNTPVHKPNTATGNGWYKLTDSAKTSQQKAIAAAVEQECTSNNSKESAANTGSEFHAAAAKDIFNNKDFFIMSGGYAKVAAGCHDFSGADSAPGGGIFVLKEQTDGSWKVLFEFNGAHNCSEWDGLGIPPALGLNCIEVTGNKTNIRPVKP